MVRVCKWPHIIGQVAHCTECKVVLLHHRHCGFYTYHNIFPGDHVLTNKNRFVIIVYQQMREKIEERSAFFHSHRGIIKTRADLRV